MCWTFALESGVEKEVLPHIIEVLTSLHDVRRPFRLINLHPALAQELS